MNHTTAIICAYNEEKTIENIIKNVYDTAFFNEIIVVNDGSVDKTALLIINLKNRVKIKDIHFHKNKGKGYAMATGIEHSKNEYIVFIDADISNFKLNHARQLVNPLLNGRAQMVLGQPSDTLIHYNINFFRHLTGQRSIIKKDIIPILERMKPSRFGVETLINMHYSANHKIVKHVCLKKLIHPTKFSKTKPLKALKEFVIEFHQILACAISNFDLTTKSTKNKFRAVFVTINKI